MGRQTGRQCGNCPCNTLQLYIHHAWLSQFWFSSAITLASFHSRFVIEIDFKYELWTKTENSFALALQVFVWNQKPRKDTVHLGNMTNCRCTRCHQSFLKNVSERIGISNFWFVWQSVIDRQDGRGNYEKNRFLALSVEVGTSLGKWKRIKLEKILTQMRNLSHLKFWKTS